MKTGPGVLVSNNLANTDANGISDSGDRLDVIDNFQLGLAAVTVDPINVDGMADARDFVSRDNGLTDCLTCIRESR